MRFLQAILVLCIMTVFVSVCSASDSAPVTNSDPKEIVTAAYQKFLALKNYHMSVATEASLSFQGKSTNIITKGEWDIQAKPMVFKNNMNIIMDTASDTITKKTERKVEQYIEESGKQLIVYSKINDQWTRQILPYSNLLNQYDNYFKAIVSVTPVNEDADSTVFEVVESASYLKENFDRVMASTGMQKVKLTDDLLKDLGDIKYTVTVDKKTATVSKIDMDLSEFVATIGNNLAESAKVPDNQKEIIRQVLTNMKVVTNIAFSRFGKVDKIIIPPEVKNPPGAFAQT